MSTPSEYSPPHKKFKKGTDHLSGWDHVLYTREGNMNTWGKFHAQWWGPDSPGKIVMQDALDAENVTSAKRVIRVNEATVWDSLDVVGLSDGWIIVRDEYAEMYDRLSHVMRVSGNTSSGVVLSGNPGIGKSYFAVYALLRRMTEGKPTLFTTSHGMSYLFNETGVRCKSKSQVTTQDLPPYKNRSTRALSLIIAAGNNLPETSAVSTPKVFTLLASSPKENRYRHWRIHSGAHFWVMNPWSEVELRVLLSNPRFIGLSGDHRDYDIRRLMDDVGPCPRDIQLSINLPVFHANDVRHALEALDMKNLANVFRGSDLAPDPHRLTLLLRTTEVKLSGEDEYLIDFKSHKVRRDAAKRFTDTSLEDRKQLLVATSNVPTRGRLAGWTFEGIVNEYLRGTQKGWASVFRDFFPMVRISSTDKWPYRFEHCLSIDSNLDRLENDDDFKYYSSGSLEQSNLPLLDSNVPKYPFAEPRNSVFYHDAESLALSTLDWYCPMKRNNPAFDSFFIQLTPQCVVLWVFQITIAKAHDGAIAGFEILKMLRKKVKSTFKKSNVTVNLVLVTPYARERVVKWNLPQDLEELTSEGGGVYIQYVNLSLGRRLEPLFAPSV